ncbi:phage protein NinX family protein [Atlantibacter hermannii]|uniref:phage protein NinX family protein n=1 Tax=Atlantibacter hermannii TaxID=565 RepID=UPI003076599F
MKVKTSELSGVQLDVAVALALEMTGGDLRVRGGYGCSYYNGSGLKTFSPSTNWSQCGELVKPHEVAFAPHPVGKLWRACALKAPINNVIEEGETPQIAICRAVVAAKLGDEVDIPDELMEVGE